jgi:hypothetical protein
MSRRANDIANALLRLGALNPDDPEQRKLREELFGDAPLWDDVSARLGAVGYDLVEMLGHVGVRLSRQTAVAPLITAKNNLGLHAGHVRVLVVLWVQLLYRQLKETLRDEATEPQGQTQTLLGFGELDDEGDHPVPTMPTADLYADLSEQMRKTQVKGVLTRLKNLKFIRESKGLLSAGPAMYVQIDHERMEEHVVGLARRGEMTVPGEETGPGEMTVPGAGDRSET